MLISNTNSLNEEVSNINLTQFALEGRNHLWMIVAILAILDNFQ